MADHVKTLGTWAGVGAALGVGVALGLGFKIFAKSAAAGVGVGLALGLLSGWRARAPQGMVPAEQNPALH